MNFKRFHAATAREALAKARMAFGEGTLILSNRPTATGVEVVATAEDALSALDSPEAASPVARRAQERSAQPEAREMQPRPAPLRNPVQEDTEKLAMSTLSFQDYVRERMLRRRHEALQGSAAQPVAAAPAAAFQSPSFTHEASVMQAPPPVARHNPLRPAPAPSPAFMAEPAPRPRREPAPVAMAPSMNPHGLLQELQSMKDLIEDRFNTLSWLGQARQNPIQSNLMLKMIRAGYSPALARAVLERLPDELDASESVRWLMEVLERNLKTDAGARPLYQEGGIYALVGSTGVGKTTTTAKLAAMCARIHGPASVGLITLDTYRVGAHEQLRAYGRMLGIVAHLAHDRAALQDLLGLLGGKKMVLIDTTGVAPRDPRKRDMLDVLNLPHVNRLLVLNAGCHGDTLDDTLAAFKTDGSQQAILSKVDEAVKLGPSIDALIRHQMVLRGVTNGQRVPEDWEAADAHKLVGTSMRAPARSAFDPKASDLNFFFSHTPQPVHDRGLVDA
ncbi:flagellar biosynthesis protein FlhF [Acidovorax sp. SRB_14]|uniref:flagellar biosynthesis protein FlhF n=1 Tax=unclassified Acidovorax TaxID=2684926 RepID=UPI00145F78D7|nr:MULTISPECIES: flagellar biosynthesis protein FlhF [unclassified Acidovorax]NMM77241.1 flagellar biosynthesis protein FlhF [Acidovorax sp. SRB_24]NMM82232.1 flagellar biosynthesis protein FlhF [Acidovorax sp. SRB_14]